MSDNLLANMLSSIKNASLIGRKAVVVPGSKLLEAVLKALLKDGYINNYSVVQQENTDQKTPKKNIQINLKYDHRGCPIIRYAYLVSKPSVRVYQGKREYKTKEQYGTLIVTTNRGVMSHVDARNMGLGGEVLCEVGC
jgi:small subunit ribosomal protein S8